MIPVDALWALYQSQSNKVRKAFRTRLLAEEKEAVSKQQRIAVKESLTKAFEELHNGMSKHNARQLFG